MQVAPSNPVLQALAGAESAASVRPQTAARTETARAVSASKEGESKRNVENPPKERGENPRRGRFVDITV